MSGRRYGLLLSITHQIRGDETVSSCKLNCYADLPYGI